MSDYSDKNSPRGISKNLSETQKVKGLEKIRQSNVKEVLLQVSDALSEKNYDPVVQIAGYILSGEPTYITGYNNARSIISRLERNEILEELVSAYLGKPKLNLRR